MVKEELDIKIYVPDENLIPLNSAYTLQLDRFFAEGVQNVRFYLEEEVEANRVNITLAGRQILFGRVIDTFSFNLSAVKMLRDKINSAIEQRVETIAHISAVLYLPNEIINEDTANEAIRFIQNNNEVSVIDPYLLSAISLPIPEHIDRQIVSITVDAIRVIGEEVTRSANITLNISGADRNTKIRVNNAFDIYKIVYGDEFIANYNALIRERDNLIKASGTVDIQRLYNINKQLETIRRESVKRVTLTLSLLLQLYKEITARLIVHYDIEKGKGVFKYRVAVYMLYKEGRRGTKAIVMNKGEEPPFFLFKRRIHLDMFIQSTHDITAQLINQEPLSNDVARMLENIVADTLLIYAGDDEVLQFQLLDMLSSSDIYIGYLYGGLATRFNPCRGYKR